MKDHETLCLSDAVTSASEQPSAYSLLNLQRSLWLANQQLRVSEADWRSDSSSHLSGPVLLATSAFPMISEQMA